MRIRQYPLIKRFYNHGTGERGENKGFCVDSEEFRDLRYQIIDQSVIIKSPDCGALVVDFKNVFRFVDELLDVVETHGELPD